MRGIDEGGAFIYVVCTCSAPDLVWVNTNRNFAHSSKLSLESYLTDWKGRHGKFCYHACQISKKFDGRNVLAYQTGFLHLSEPRRGLHYCSYLRLLSSRSIVLLRS
jgi:hypothetical protein